MAEWKWPKGNWWKPKPNWWTRSAHYHRLSDGAKTILVGAWDLADGDLIVPADPQMLATAAGVDTRPARVAEHVAAIIEGGFAVGVGDGLMRLVHEYSEHCRVAAARTESVPKAYRKRTRSVPADVPAYAVGTPMPHTSEDLSGPNKNSVSKNDLPPSEGDARDVGAHARPSSGDGFALASPSSEPDRRKAQKDGESVRRRSDVFAAWKDAFSKGPNAKMVAGDKRDKTIQARLKEGRTVEDLIRCVQGYALDPWRHEAASRNELATLLRDGAHVEAGLELAEKGPAPDRVNGNGHVAPKPNQHVRAYNPVMTPGCVVSSPESAARWLVGEAERKARGEDF